MSDRYSDKQTIERMWQLDPPTAIRLERERQERLQRNVAFERALAAAWSTLTGPPPAADKADKISIDNHNDDW